jgi:hypothetical protein
VTERKRLESETKRDIKGKYRYKEKQKQREQKERDIEKLIVTETKR